MKVNSKKNKRLKRAKRTRAKIYLSQKPRLTIHKTSNHIYAQLFDCSGSQVHAQSSTLDNQFRTLKATGNCEAAAEVGKVIAERANAKGFSEVAFDRSGFSFHGRVKALADAARLNGLKF